MSVQASQNVLEQTQEEKKNEIDTTTQRRLYARRGIDAVLRFGRSNRATK